MSYLRQRFNNKDMLYAEVYVRNFSREESPGLQQMNTSSTTLPQWHFSYGGALVLMTRCASCFMLIGLFISKPNLHLNPIAIISSRLSAINYSKERGSHNLHSHGNICPSLL